MAAKDSELVIVHVFCVVETMAVVLHTTFLMKASISAIKAVARTTFMGCLIPGNLLEFESLLEILEISWNWTLYPGNFMTGCCLYNRSDRIQVIKFSSTPVT